MTFTDLAVAILYADNNTILRNIHYHNEINASRLIME